MFALLNNQSINQWFMFLNTCFSFKISSAFALNKTEAGISSPPCFRTAEYLHFPVTVHWILPPCFKNSKQTYKISFKWWVPDDSTVLLYSHSISVVMISCFSRANQHFSASCFPHLLINVVSMNAHPHLVLNISHVIWSQIFITLKFRCVKFSWVCFSTKIWRTNSWHEIFSPWKFLRIR